jgi:inorganic pyrophosphatase
MPDLTSLPIQLDKKKNECRAVVETPRYQRNKFDYDPETDLFELRGLLPEGMMFPCDFGFMPSTLGQDGDPLDILVLMDEPTHVGCLLRVRIIGVIEAKQTEKGKTETNSRFLGVSIHSFRHENVRSIKDLTETMVHQIEQFFVDYNRLRGKKFEVTARGGPRRAIELIEEGMRAKK